MHFKLWPRVQMLFWAIVCKETILWLLNCFKYYNFNLIIKIGKSARIG